MPKFQTHPGRDQAVETCGVLRSMRFTIVRPIVALLALPGRSSAMPTSSTSPETSCEQVQHHVGVRPALKAQQKAITCASYR
jgi:hypothetical protein